MTFVYFVVYVYYHLICECYSLDLLHNYTYGELRLRCYPQKINVKFEITGSSKFRSQ